MKTLWAPWRMQFIEDLRDKETSCIFCQFKQEGDDRERLVLHRSAGAYVVMNRYPYNSGHLLIVPNSHQGRLIDVPPEERASLMQLCAESVEILKDTLHAEGVNCGANLGRAAGAGITDHVHLHVVPRWNGDTNFLPILSETRSMPEYLHETYDKLAKEFARLTTGG